MQNQNFRKFKLCIRYYDDKIKDDVEGRTAHMN
jgi:hypothetical protein